MKSILKRVLALALCVILVIPAAAITVFADSAKVVTMGVDLTESQKELMWEYFDVDKNDVVYIEVNNKQEREYLEGVATEQQIGTHTLSCAYVEPTEEGGIQVKTANLTWVTSSMIASTLATCGIENCNVVAACPIAVSGTGALTGIIIAYEKATGEELDEDKKEAAVEELIVTGDIADDIGQDDASLLINDIKEEVIEAGSDITPEKIGEIIEEKAEKYNIALTDEQKQKIEDLMAKISQMEYDIKAIKATINNIQDSIEGISKKVEEGKNFFQKIWAAISGFFGGKQQEVEDAKENVSSVLANTKDYLLGDDAVIDATDDVYVEETETADQAESEDDEQELTIWQKIANWFKNLFGGKKETVEETEVISDTTTVTDDESITLYAAEE